MNRCVIFIEYNNSIEYNKGGEGELGRVKCEVCGHIAKTLYIREIRKEKHWFDSNDEVYKTKFVAVGYYCSHCQRIVFKGTLYISQEEAIDIKETLNYLKEHGIEEFIAR